ncbi:MAG: NAD-dependent epimerase/dehydratase family protein [Candidatus Thermoplasmatota archaeon]|nr:NAD-dependent epimerase/dehydratase family protein [Candidatus Thermoplasmatota archaeon]
MKVFMMAVELDDGWKKFLVAGGAGFIGSHLVRYLLSREETEHVLVIDNFISGSWKNIEDLLDDPRMEVMDSDIIDTVILERDYPDLDIVLHLATIANPTDYERNPISTLSVNSIGTSNLIEIAGKTKAMFVFFSSSEVYGSHEISPGRSLSEICHSRIILNQKRSPYVVGKCYGEELTISRCNENNIPYLIIRPFNIYGSNMDMESQYGRVITNFIIWGLEGNSLRVHGDGTQIRSFCHIDDFLAALFQLLNRGIVGKSINIGYPHPISILDLAHLICELIGVEEDFKYVKRYEFEPFWRIPDIALIKELTGWEPQKNLRKGLIETIQWFRSVGMERYSKINTTGERSV